MANHDSQYYIVKNDIKRYKKNSMASNITYLAVVFLVLYFLILYANRVGNYGLVFDKKVLGTDAVYSYAYGVDVILNLFVLLFGFFTAVKLGGYSKSFTYVSYVLAAVEIARIFFIPYTFWNVGTDNNTVMVDTNTFVWLVVMLATSAACFVGAGILGYVRADQREKFQKKLDNNEIDLEAALVDKNDTLSADTTPVDVLDEDLGDKTNESEEGESEALVEAETTLPGGGEG